MPKTVMHVYICNDFPGHNPVGTAAVIVAPNMAMARKLLVAKLKAEHKLDITVRDFNLDEINVGDVGAYVLNDGDY